MNGIRALRLTLLLVPFTTAALCAPFTDPPPVNDVPEARVVWPQLWRVSDPVPFDATSSTDPEALIDGYRMIFGDGTEAQENGEGVFQHLYAEAGSYDFRLRVTDEGGLVAEVEGNVVVVETLDDPACSCDLPCFDAAVCTTTGCFLTARSTVDDAEIVPLPGTVVECETTTPVPTDGGAI